MRKVKQLYRQTFARTTAAPQRVFPYLKVFDRMWKTSSVFSKYSFNSSITLNQSQRGIDFSKLHVTETMSDKKGFADLLSSESSMNNSLHFGDFEKVNKNTFVHALNIPKHEIDFVKFSISDVETVCSEAVDEAALSQVRMDAMKKFEVEEGSSELVHKNMIKIQENTKNIKASFVAAILRRSLLGTPPMFLFQKC